MVRTSISDAERRAWNRVIALGFVLVVGGSAGLTAFFGGASLVETAALTGLGLVTGTGLVYYLSTLSMEPSGRREHRER